MTIKGILPLAKIIGIGLFIWIITSINHEELLRALTQTDLQYVAASFIGIGGIFLGKTLRWHRFTQLTPAKQTLYESWKAYAIGTFLGNITPGKLGEFGKAAYLHKKGVPLKIGVLLSLIDRIADAVIIALIGIYSIGHLFNPSIAIALVGMGLLAVCIAAIVLRFFPLFPLLHLVLPRMPWNAIATILLYTCFVWCMYFVWAVLLARSMAINVDIPTLVAAFTMTGLLSMLPIAPSGLGTRDAALLVLLGSYGVHAEQAVALALLMFTTIMMMGIPGAWYWIAQKQDR